MIDLNSIKEFGTPTLETTILPIPSGIKIGHVLVGVAILGGVVYLISTYYKNKYEKGVKIVKPIK